MQKFMTTQVFKKKYGTEEHCLKALLEFRMSEDRICFSPNCDAPIDRYYHRLRGKKAFICSKCLKHVYPMVDSIFDHTHVAINDWFEIMFKMVYSRNGISAKEIHRTYGFSYPTVFRVLNAIRQLMDECLDFEFANTVVEIDESYVPTGGKGMGRHFYMGRGRGNQRNTTILAIIERRGKCKMFVIPSADADTIIPIITANVPVSTTISTDTWGAYNKLKSLGYDHVMVNHHKHEFTRENASTNSAENAFKNFKSMIEGTYRNVTQKTLPNYLSEFSFRHTFRYDYDYGFHELLKRLPSLTHTYSKIAA
ncbi:MAG: transposase [Bacteroidetes bacterium]|nr:transposase [Bacteroidota bacterium]